MSGPVSAPFESVLLDELADVEPEHLAASGLDVVTTEGRHLLSGASPALRDAAWAWLESALILRNEWLEEQREHASGLSPLALLARDEGEPR